MGGDGAPAEVDSIMASIRRRHPGLRIAWWSGRSLLSPHIHLDNLDYLKLGPYLAHLGPINTPGSNQHLYLINHGTLTDITNRLRHIGRQPS